MTSFYGNLGGTGGGGDGGVTNHGDLTGRSLPNQHPASAIQLSDGTNVNDKINSNTTTIAAMQAEATAKWIILNDVETRSRENADDISDLQSTIGDLNNRLEARLDG